MNILDKTRLLQTSILSSLIMGLGGVAYAQTTDVQQVPADEEFFEDADTVVVTGSRIRRPELNTIFPTTNVTAESLEKSAFTNIADALTEIPAFGGGIDPNGGQGANIGANFVDFLDLGVQRTLTLVNGRRFVGGDVGGNGLSVDFNVIPISLVERIETIGVGGAPIYGADAIAGTINVILKDDFEGLDVSAQYGETDRGDGNQYQYQVVAGANTEDGRGNVTFSVEYSNQDGITQLDRPEIFTGEPFLSRVAPGTPGFNDVDTDGDGTPDTAFRVFNEEGGNPVNVQLFTLGGVVAPFGSGFAPSVGLGGFPDPAGGSRFFQFSDTGELVPFIAGVPVPGQNIVRAQGGNEFDFFDLAGQVRSPLERIVFGSTVKYDITNNIRFKGDFQAANTESTELANQGGFQTGFFGGLSAAIQLPVSNPFLTPQAQDLLINDLGFGPDDQFSLNRFNNDLIDDGARASEGFVWRIAGGLEGDFEVAGREFYWDFSGVAGQTTTETQSQPIINNTRFLNAVEAVRLSQADVDGIAANGNNPIGAAGDIVCQVTRDYSLLTGAQQNNPFDPAAIAIRGVVSGSGLINDDPRDVIDCLPLNLFGANNADPAALDFVVQRGLTTSDFEQRIWSANITGDLIQLPAGWLKFAAGYETRRENALFATGGAVEAALGRGAGVPDSGGGFSTDEWTGELYLPIVNPDLEIPLVYDLQAEGSIRQINSSIGGDNTVWTAGGRYSPVADLTIRGNRTRSVRSPSLTELFLPQITTFQFAADPCDARFINDGDNAANRAANCAAIGITQPFTSNVADATAMGTTGGNPDLISETADSWTLGAILQPRFVPGLTITADYINIDLEDRIGAASLLNNLETCFESDPSAFPNVAECNTFTRDADGQVVDFTAGQANGDSNANQFLNLNLDYRFDVADALSFVTRNDAAGDYGDFRFDFSAFHVIEREIVNSGVTADNTVGQFFDPRWSGTADFTWTKDQYRLFWRTLWQDRDLFDPEGDDIFVDADDNIVNSVGGRFIHNASFSVDVSEFTEAYDKPIVLQLTVNNVFNRTPGRGLDRQFNNFGVAEQLGRTFQIRARASF